MYWVFVYITLWGTLQNFFKERKKIFILFFQASWQKDVCSGPMCSYWYGTNTTSFKSGFWTDFASFYSLFNGLKRAYACHAEHENDSDDDDEAEDDDETGKGFAM